MQTDKLVMDYRANVVVQREVVVIDKVIPRDINWKEKEHEEVGKISRRRVGRKCKVKKTVAVTHKLEKGPED